MDSGPGTLVEEGEIGAPLRGSTRANDSRPSAGASRRESTSAAETCSRARHPARRERAASRGAAHQGRQDRAHPGTPASTPRAVVLDHHSRAVVACIAFRKQPTAAAICALLDRAILDAGRAPRHLVTDRGVQFQSEYLAWCERRRVRPRFGAVGKKGSIALVERFIRSLKDECLRRIPVSLESAALRREIDAYVGWYNAFRPHSSLGGAAPADRLARRRGFGIAIETRPRYPLRRRGKRRRRRRLRGTLRLVIEHHRGRPHLPVVTLREAA